MKNLRLALAALVIAAGSFTFFAFTKANGEAKKAPKTYWVVGMSGPNYIVSDNPDDAGPCIGESDPCEIFTSETPHPITYQLTPAQMSSPNTRIDSRQNLP
ncbi:hypothetical protein [Pedobacter nyackensis]|uniref:Uncharacterized protein n=1 Tax=Pedobacter nyackensis TaxID=475255 RepID=A0A1W2DW31_9SPHI|nr:hypothetical protein [Pedobacter nyackensis]SMD01282.1 hypothetical protein SAMN04488101_108159 [Pedobacter nyackensis]